MDKKGITTTALFVLQLLRVTSCIILNENEQQSLQYKHCKIQNIKYVALNCSNQNLTYIPKVGSNVEMIIFSYNSLPNVTLETFDNVSTPEHISRLQLDYDDIQNISSNALDKFINLTNLDLSGNPLNFENLKGLLGATTKLRLLHTLKLNNMHDIIIQKDLFSLMYGTRISFMSLECDKLKSVSLEMFQIFSMLKGLVFSKNQIEDFKLFKFPYMQELNLQHNNLNVIPNFCVTDNITGSFFPQLKVLDLSFNRIATYKKDDLNCVRNLKQLHLQSNLINPLPNDMLINVPKLSYLDVSYQNVRRFRIEPYTFRSKSLLRLWIAYQSRAIDVFVSLNKTFRATPNLRYLYIKSIVFSKMNGQEIRTIFSHLTKLVHFCCRNCGLYQDLKFFLAQKPYLTILDLPNNMLHSISSETFSHNKLKQLKLPGNKIGYVSKSTFPEKVLRRLKVLDLSLNPFVCDCNLEWFINWLKLKQHNVTVLYYPKEYTCTSPDSMTGKQLANVRFSYIECHLWSPWIWVAIIVGSIFIIASITGFFLYRNRWNIKHYVYLLRKRRNYQLLNGKNYLYDAFVCYDAADSVWVRRRLLPLLEEEESMKLCIHERDFRAGVFINDNIVTNMEASRKIIIILTNKFAQSGWCMFELKIAHTKQIEDETEVIVILLERIDAKNMNHSLKTLFDTTTYIEWTEDVAGQDLFWTQLKDAAKK